MLQFPPFPIADAIELKVQEVLFGNPGIKGSMRLPQAYRSLARPSSAPEPSHPPDGVAVADATIHKWYSCAVCNPSD